MRSYKTPLRYPGGKSRAVDYLFSDKNLPTDIQEYRDPFLGGGSPAIAFTKKFPNIPVWVNDKYTNLYYFWITLRDNVQDLYDIIVSKRAEYDTDEKAKELFLKLRDDILEQTDPFEIAWRFYIINKCSFSGLTLNSGFSKSASVKNWTYQNIKSLKVYSNLIQNWKITNTDYTELLTNNKNTFIFLDPPYDLKTDYTLSGGDGEILYGQKGDMHKGFNHVEFSENLNKHKSMMMVTYNSNENIRKLFDGWRQIEWDLSYTMVTSSKEYMTDQKSRKELLCLNYEQYNPLGEFYD